MTPIRLAIIEDDPEVRQLLHPYFGRQPEFACVIIADLELRGSTLTSISPKPAAGTTPPAGSAVTGLRQRCFGLPWPHPRISPPYTAPATRKPTNQA